MMTEVDPGVDTLEKRIPRVSIGLPVYNGENYLAEAIDSLLSQTYADFELIISDNASTDHTGEICRNFAALDQRIHYFLNAENIGGANNDNRVFELSSGSFFKWAHHDDRCHPEFLEKCVNVLDSDPTVVLSYPKTIVIDECGNFVENYHDGFNLCSPKPHERFRLCLGREQLLNPLHGVIRANVIRKTQLIKSYEASDLTFLAELTLHGKFYEVPERLFYRRMHPRKATAANVTAEEIAIWYDPANQGKIQSPRIRRFYGFFTAISRSRLNIIDKLRCHNELVRFYLDPELLNRRWKGLLLDLNQAIRVILYNLMNR